MDEEIFPPTRPSFEPALDEGRPFNHLGGGNFQLIGPEQLQSGTPYAFQRSLALELSQDVPGHLSGGADEPGKIRPCEDRHLSKEQVTVLRQNAKHAEPGILVQEAFDALDGLL
jgi:hypothetical protein